MKRNNVKDLMEYQIKKESNELRCLLESIYPNADLAQESRAVLASCNDFKIKSDVLDRLNVVKILALEIFPNAEIVFDQELSSLVFFSLDIIIKDEQVVLQKGDIAKFVQLLDITPTNYNIRARKESVSISFQYKDVYELKANASGLSRHLFESDWFPTRIHKLKEYANDNKLLHDLYDTDFDIPCVTYLSNNKRYTVGFSDTGLYVDGHNHYAMKNLLSSAKQVSLCYLDEWKGAMIICK